MLKGQKNIIFFLVVMRVVPKITVEIHKKDK